MCKFSVRFQVFTESEFTKLLKRFTTLNTNKVWLRY
uniref:Uncharacterized protein n=1 Tax=Anguilla anguilla TaxID=7936 RepID=A0A0E9R479_ANGAN